MVRIYKTEEERVEANKARLKARRENPKNKEKQKKYMEDHKDKIDEARARYVAKNKDTINTRRRDARKKEKEGKMTNTERKKLCEDELKNYEICAVCTKAKRKTMKFMKGDRWEKHLQTQTHIKNVAKLNKDK